MDNNVCETIKRYTEQRDKLEKERYDLETEKDCIEARLEEIDDDMAVCEKNIETLENSVFTPEMPGYRLYWAQKLIAPEHDIINGQFRFGDRYAISNGYVACVFNEPIDGMQMCNGISKHILDSIFECKVTPIDIKTSAVQMKHTNGLILIGEVLIQKKYFDAVQKFMLLDDTTKYYSFCIKNVENVIMVCQNGEKAVILGLRRT